MNFIEYFKDSEYIDNKNDCWTFVQRVFKDEHGFILPNHPIMTTKSDIATYLKNNIQFQIINKAEKGCIVYYKHGTTHHAGYSLNNKEFIHKTLKGVIVSKIPENAIIYKVLND